MSYVTSAVIFVDYAPRPVRERLEEQLEFACGQGFNRLDDSGAGGWKCMQSEVYAAGFNYIAATALDEWFLALPWGSTGSAVLVHESEGDFRRVVMTPGWSREREETW